MDDPKLPIQRDVAPGESRGQYGVLDPGCTEATSWVICCSKCGAHSGVFRPDGGLVQGIAFTRRVIEEGWKTCGVSGALCPVCRMEEAQRRFQEEIERHQALVLDLGLSADEAAAILCRINSSFLAAEAGQHEQAP